MKKKYKIKTNKMFSNKMFSKYLNYAAAFIILTIIIIFISRINYFEKRNTIYTVRQYNIEPEKIKENEKILIKKSIDSLNTQVNELKKIKIELEDIQKKNNEEFRFYLAIIGSILAIVGFFGFKSIHDTRQAAMEAVKIKSEDIAEKVTNNKISELSKTHVEDFLKNDGRKNIESIAEKIAAEKGVEVAKERMSLIEIDNKNYRNSVREDIETIQQFQNKNFNFLLKRIQELENKLYGNPDIDDTPDLNNNPVNNPDNEQPVL